MALGAAPAITKSWGDSLASTIAVVLPQLGTSLYP